MAHPRPTRRRDFLLRRRRTWVDWLVVIFIWITLAAALAWIARAGFRATRDETELEWVPLWR